jgi:hypothetical protein
MASLAATDGSSVLFSHMIGTTAARSANFAPASPFNFLKIVLGSTASKFAWLIALLAA